MHCQHALASEDVLSLLSQQIPHEHVEAVLIQRPTSNDAHAANTTQVVQLLPAPLWPPVTLQAQQRKTQVLNEVSAQLCQQQRLATFKQNMHLSRMHHPPAGQCEAHNTHSELHQLKQAAPC
jgi:hypothetical protein